MNSGAQLIYGDDGTLVRRRAAEFVDEELRRKPGCQLEVFIGQLSSAQDFRRFADALREALVTLPLFSPSKCIWVKSVNFLATPLAEESMALLEQLGDQLAHAKDFGLTVVLSACPVDRRLRPFKLLRSKCQSIEVKGNGPNGAETALADGAEELGLFFDFSARRAFLDRVGPDAGPVALELKKLKAYLSGKCEVTADDVRAIVCETAREDFFESVEAFYRRDMAAFASALRRFLGNNGEPRALLAAMQNRNRILIQLKAAQELRFWRTDGLPSKWTLERARSLRTVPIPEGGDDVFSLNPWYLGRLSECLAFFDLSELVRVQGALLDIFESLIRDWQDLSAEWLFDKFLFLSACLRDPTQSRTVLGSCPCHG
ncbi:MAG: hypothetical protein LBH53_03015 [Puniceicoccales bacterium]|nr:hypothetical protein [Puniceicoccales bacterium]